MFYFLINLITEVSETLYIFFNNNNIIIDINQLLLMINEFIILPLYNKQISKI